MQQQTPRPRAPRAERGGHGGVPIVVSVVKDGLTPQSVGLRGG